MFSGNKADKMIDFYYQIKGKANAIELGYGGNWSFPPIFSGKVSAKDKNRAKAMIELEYNKQFPVRVLSKDLDSNEFLLSIKEIEGKNKRIYRLFEYIKCEQCECEFRIIDSYNDSNQSYKGQQYCSDKCKEDAYVIRLNEYKFKENINGSSLPVIYKITNKTTGLSYIGKTTQVFTLRWYQHFFHGSETEFHKAIKDSDITDWIFEILESIYLDNSIIKTSTDADNFILEREKHWIDKFNTIIHGYNSLIPTSK